MYICICKSITDTQIRAAADAGVNSLSKLKKKYGLASCCGSCIEMTQSILNENTAEKRNPRIYVPSAA
ncbi:MAG: (2Fe-2S)-binding protein [Woeseiaceae bacterium]|jgi:bacterioferritin-associated ferredoxin|nr:(2Fe-2S)-binding protein [Woeseiaceae bacterium]